MSSPVRYRLDKRAFGLVHFPRPSGVTRAPMPPVQSALEATLGVKIATRRKGLFGPKVMVFTYMGETVQIGVGSDGDLKLDLSVVDDEVRETLMEALRVSQVFVVG